MRYSGPGNFILPTTDNPPAIAALASRLLTRVARAARFVVSGSIQEVRPAPPSRAAAPDANSVGGVTTIPVGVSGRASWFSLCHFFGIILGMKTTIDAAGRIVVPKPLRLALGLQPGQALDIRAGDGRLEIEIAATPMQLKRRGKGMVAVPHDKLPSLTAELVRETLERVRR
jgi:AbrB family looped-hinge helix DNA binding protein